MVGIRQWCARIFENNSPCNRPSDLYQTAARYSIPRSYQHRLVYVVRYELLLFQRLHTTTMRLSAAHLESVLLLLVISSFAPYRAHAQNESCGTVADSAMVLFNSEHPLVHIDASMRGGTVYLPITAHIVRTTTGTGGLSVSNLNTAIDDANSVYIDAGIQFILCGPIEYINNSTWYNMNLSVTSESVLAAHDVDNVINAYFFNNLNDIDGSSLCGKSHFPGDGIDRFLMDNSCTTINNVFAHEIGHYFNLLHTHETAFGIEYVNGSNCTSAGDLLCDTPADPNIDNQVNTSCVWTGSEDDPLGDPYDPSTRNIMSYSDNNCRDEFTSMQYDRIYDAYSTFRPYLTCNVLTNDACADAIELFSGAACS